MFIQALLIGVIGGLAEWDSRIFGDNMLGRPIILGNCSCRAGVG